ncbi:MAG: phosphate signaling complex protein PhoU [Ignavibacteriae bacterium]|nr:phosphate signaling complex protein PhoU [Ignavibacteriota bacterium]
MHRGFEDELDKLRTRLVRMGSIVEEQVEFAFRALLEGNTELAKIVQERDDKVDKLDIKIDKQCQRIFALQQPVASDLRLLLAAIKINNELERIGDMASNVAGPVLSIDSLQKFALELGMERITQAAFRMVKASLDAFINNDPELAKHILPTDDTVDNLEMEIIAEVIKRMKSDKSYIDAGVALIDILRQIERIADHATNIAENVIFLIEARLVRHRQIDEDGSILDAETYTDDSGL